MYCWQHRGLDSCLRLTASPGLNADALKGDLRVVSGISVPLQHQAAGEGTHSLASLQVQPWLFQLMAKFWLPLSANVKEKLSVIYCLNAQKSLVFFSNIVTSFLRCFSEGL